MKKNGIYSNPTWVAAIGTKLLLFFMAFTVFAIAPQFIQDQQDGFCDVIVDDVMEEEGKESKRGSRTNPTVEEEDEVTHPEFRLHELTVLSEYMRSKNVIPSDELSHTLISPPPEQA